MDITTNINITNTDEMKEAFNCFSNMLLEIFPKPEVLQFVLRDIVNNGIDYRDIIRYYDDVNLKINSIEEYESRFDRNILVKIDEFVSKLLAIGIPKKDAAIVNRSYVTYIIKEGLTDKALDYIKPYMVKGQIDNVLLNVYNGQEDLIKYYDRKLDELYDVILYCKLAIYLNDTYDLNKIKINVFNINAMTIRAYLHEIRYNGLEEDVLIKYLDFVNTLTD